MLSKTRLKLGQLGRHTAHDAVWRPQFPAFLRLKSSGKLFKCTQIGGELARLKRFFEIIDTKTALRRRAVGILEKLKCVV